MKLPRSDYDVVVVGAGPAGSAAAMAASRGGARTLLLEKHPTVGVPLSCAEGISTYGLTEVLGEIETAWVSAPIDRAVLVSPDNTRACIDHPGAGVILERKVFDRDLATRAARAGAELRMESPVVGLESNGDGFRGVTVQTPGGRRSVGARVIIAADGVESQVGRWAGLNTRMRLDRMDSGIQYLLGNVDVRQGELEFYFGTRIAPGGYAWVFPKSDDTANVGIAVTPACTDGISARSYLDDFISTRFGSGPTMLETMVGGIPAFYGHRLLRRQNVLLVGDAARLIDSITGAGIANALLSGHLAGGAAARFVQSGRSSDLDLYARAWRARKGRQMRLYYLAREIFLKMQDADLNLVIDGLRGVFNGKTVTHVDPVETIKLIFRMHRPLLGLVRRLEWR